jgi:hypothetical protein
MTSLLEKTKNIIKKKYPPFEYIVFKDTYITPLHKCKLALLTTGGLHLFHNIYIIWVNRNMNLKKKGRIQ